MHNATRLRAALLGSGTVLALTVGPAFAGQADDLQTQITTLQTRLDELQKQQAVAPAQAAAPADAVVGGDYPGSFKLPGSDTSYSIHGFVKLGMSYDSNENVSDAFIPEGFSANNAAGGNHSWHYTGYTNASRLHIESRTPTDYGQMKTVMEFDYRTSSDSAFNGASAVSGSNAASSSDPTGKGSARLRLAYGVLGPIEGGKDFELMENDFASAPETVDYWGPQGPSYGGRTPLLRYTQALGKMTLAGEITANGAIGSESIAFNSEQSYFQSGTLTGSGGSTLGGSAQYSNMPTFAAAADYTDSWGHVHASGTLRQLHVENGGGATITGTPVGSNLTTYGYAGYLGGSANMGNFLPVLGKDTVGASMIWGAGDTQDISGADDSESAAVINFGGTGAKITATPMHGFQVNYRHWWTNTIRTNLIWGLTQMTPSHDVSTYSSGAALSSSSASLTTQSQTVWANVIWSPVSTVNFGLEYLWGEVHHLPYVNGTTVSTGATGYTGYGSDQRIELGMQYLF